MSAVILPFPARPRPAHPATALASLDRRLLAAERALYEARAWLPRSRGAGLARLVVEIAELEAEVVELERERRREVGAELAVIRGGLDG